MIPELRKEGVSISQRHVSGPMRVFISTTTHDLGQFRQGLADYLRRLHCDVEVQEEFTADYRTIHDLLVSKIKPCDAVVCLIGAVFGGQPLEQHGDVPRSFTQLEYFIAREYRKPVFLFFPAAGLELPASPHDTDEQRALQRNYAEELRSRPEIWYEFGDSAQLHERVAEAVQNVERLASLGTFARTVQDEYPTPLARLFAENLNEGDADRLSFLADESLRWIALLAAHDAAVHGLFAADRAEPIDGDELLRAPTETRHWRKLVQLGTPAMQAERFIPTLSGWETRLEGVLSAIEAAFAQLGPGARRSRTPRRQVAQQLGEAVASLYRELDFLRRYVLATVLSTDVSTRCIEIKLFRGLHPTNLTAQVEPDEPIPASGSLFLLSLDQRSALVLEPALWYRPTASQDSIWGLLEIEDADSGIATLAAFEEQDPVTVEIASAMPASSSDLDVDHSRTESVLPPPWRKAGIENPMVERDAARSALRRALLDSESWKHLHAAIVPEAETDRLVGGRFRLLGQAVHRGRNLDVYEAHSETTAESGDASATAPQRFAVHLLRREGVEDPHVREWLMRRIEHWRRLESPRIVRPSDASDPAMESPRPFLASCYISPRSLATDVAAGRRLSDAEIIDIVSLAADVCESAHQQGLRMLALPLRHFLIGSDDRCWVTGFDTLVPANGRDWPAQRTLADAFQELSKDWDTFAPELSRPVARLPETVDVFALGVLLARLRGCSSQAMEQLPAAAWSDPWQQLQFHCLCVQPALRCQSITQFRRLLAAVRTPRWTETIPVVDIEVAGSGHNGNGPPRQMMLNLVTNSQYVDFCRDTQRPPPAHFQRREQNEQMNRLSAPCCPAVFVHHEDASEFGKWLSRITGRRWRLPTEAEWLAAATGEDGRSYPWGETAPRPDLANYEDHYGGTTLVGAFDAGRSPCGCYDMAGNVWEWCSDRDEQSVPRRVLKGGAFHYSGDCLRSNSRESAIVYYRSPHVGFRLLCDNQEQPA